MARYKKTPFPPWQTRTDDGIEKRYVRLGNSQLLDEAFKRENLSHAAFRIYVNMLLEAGGKREFTFSHRKYSRIVSDGGFQSAKNELIEKGLIEVAEAYRTRSNVYRFSEGWKQKDGSHTEKF